MQLFSISECLFSFDEAFNLTSVFKKNFVLFLCTVLSNFTKCYVSVFRSTYLGSFLCTFKLSCSLVVFELQIHVTIVLEIAQNKMFPVVKEEKIILTCNKILG